MTGEMLVFVIVFVTALLYFGGKIGSSSLDSAFAEEEV